MYFDSKGNLKKIPELNFWPLQDVIIEKFFFSPFNFRYHVKKEEARMINDFLIPMLEFDPLKRISAQDSLQDKWLTSVTNENFYMEEAEFNAYTSEKQMQQFENEQVFEQMHMNEGSEVDFADSEDNSFVNEEMNDSFYVETKQKIDMKIIDRSFCNLGYVGFGDGIDFDTLDQTRNWQFDAD